MQMSSGRSIWKIFFILTCGASLWFLGQFTAKIIPYIRHSQVAFGNVSEFKVKPLSEDKYAVEAKFSFEARGKTYSSSYTFIKPIFLNPFGAESHIKNFWKTQDSWLVYYSKSNPNYCALQKIFPFKYLFNFGITLCILFYFIWLRSYVARMN